MTSPVVSECSKAPEPVDRDTFIDAAGERRQPAWPPPRRRPADA